MKESAAEVRALQHLLDRSYAREVYDFDWDALADGALYARIEPRSMLAFRKP